jgi:hypothetical protein
VEKYPSEGGLELRGELWLASALKLHLNPQAQQRRMRHPNSSDQPTLATFLWQFGLKAINLAERLRMTIKVELNPETEARLIAEARALGVPLEKLAERLLKEALITNSVPHGVLTVDEFHRMLSGIVEGSDELPDLPTESFSRESFYADRLDGSDAIPGR